MNLEIHFGDEYRAQTREERYVITDIGTGPYFFASLIGVNLSGEETLTLSATQSPGDIKELAARWNLERITEAYVRYWSGLPEGEVNKILADVIEASKRPSRLIA